MFRSIVLRVDGLDKLNLGGVKLNCLLFGRITASFPLKRGLSKGRQVMEMGLVLQLSPASICQSANLPDPARLVHPVRLSPTPSAHLLYDLLCVAHPSLASTKLQLASGCRPSFTGTSSLSFSYIFTFNLCDISLFRRAFLSVINTASRAFC